MKQAVPAWNRMAGFPDLEEAGHFCRYYDVGLGGAESRQTTPGDCEKC